MLHLRRLRVCNSSWTASTSAQRSSAAASPGLGMAIRLKQEGIDDFTVLERGDDVGGTWHYNTYPGCACDVPSHLYSFSFAPNPEWSETYSRQPEIRDYLRRVADELRRPRAGAAELHRRGHRVGRDARLDDRDLRRAAARPRRGRRHGAAGRAEDPRRSRASTSSRARCSTPRAGTTTTTSRGKRVAAIGTGASAIQFVPEIQKEVEQLHVIQRTAAVGHAAPEPRDPRLGEAPLRPRSRRCRSSCAAASTRAASCSCSASSSTRG